MHTAENMVQNDGARLVTLTLALSTELPYTIGEPSSVTIRVLDDDTAPAAPMNLRAASGDRRATLTWDAPSAGIAIEKYQERHALSSTSLPSTWTDIPSSAGEDREYTVTGLTNDSQYTFEVRAVNGSLQGSASTVMATPREHGVCIEPSDIAEGESATVTILPQGAPFTTTRVISVVLPSAGGDDKPRKGTDFTVSAPGRSLTPSPGTDPEGMFTGHHPKYTTQIEPGETTVTLTIDAIENSDPECQEDFHVYAYLDGTSGTRIRAVGTDKVTINDDDTQAELESAVVNGRTVTLTFSTAMSHVQPPSDPNHIDYEENPNSPQQFFTLFEGNPKPTDNNIGSSSYKVEYGTLARTFSISGRVVTLTFPKAIDTNSNAWVRYDRFSRYSPLGPTTSTGRCSDGRAVQSFITQLDGTGNTGGTATLPALTIADAEGREGVNANIPFTVTLTPASTEIVVVDYRTIARTATAGEDFTPTTGRLTFAPGQTTKTVRVPIIDDAVEDDGETFLLDLYNASGATMVDTESWATSTIRNTEEEQPETPANTLTASFANVPAEHGGAGESNRFTFDLTFSEETPTSYKTLRDHSFSITGGHVRKARRRQQGSNIGWQITVEPSGWGDIAISLPGGRACTTSGAICTADDRQLSNSPSATVQGPAALSVADANADENSDAALDADRHGRLRHVERHRDCGQRLHRDQRHAHLHARRHRQDRLGADPRRLAQRWRGDTDADAVECEQRAHRRRHRHRHHREQRPDPAGVGGTLRAQRGEPRARCPRSATGHDAAVLRAPRRPPAGRLPGRQGSGATLGAGQQPQPLGGSLSR